MMFGFLGAGAQADETEEYFDRGSAQFCAIHTPGADRLGNRRIIDIENPDPQDVTVPVIAAVGAPGLRRHLVSCWRGRDFASVVARSSWVSPSAEVGDGVVVAPSAIITAGVAVRDHALINVGASVSHRTTVGSFATISPGARIAGDCSIGDGVFIGINATVSHGVSIVSGAVLGAGAVVVRDIVQSGVYAGNPVRLLRPTDGWLMRLR